MNFSSLLSDDEQHMDSVLDFSKKHSEPMKESKIIVIVPKDSIVETIIFGKVIVKIGNETLVFDNCILDEINQCINPKRIKERDAVCDSLDLRLIGFCGWPKIYVEDHPNDFLEVVGNHTSLSIDDVTLRKLHGKNIVKYNNVILTECSLTNTVIDDEYLEKNPGIQFFETHLFKYKSFANGNITDIKH